MPAYVRTELRQGAFAIVWLERAPVNLMDLSMWQQLAAALEQLEGNPVCHQFCMDTPWRSLNSMHEIGPPGVWSGVASWECTRMFRIDKQAAMRQRWRC